jgi:hypothetical protein
METRLILAVWWLSVIANGSLAVKATRPWLWKRYPLFGSWVIYQALVSAVLIVATGPALRPHPYAEIWKIVQLPSAIFQALVAVEAFWVLARQFRGMNLFARRLLGCLAAAAALVSVAVARNANPWAGDLRPYFIFWEHVALALSILCLLALWFFGRHLDFGGLRPNSRVHAAILAGLFFSMFLASYLMNASYGTWRFMAGMLIPGGQLVAFALWLVLFKRTGEVVRFDERPIMSAGEYAALEGVDQHYSRKLEEISSEALRKAVRLRRT